MADDDRQELRFAVVMTGGVSLAVWMGGVAHELNRLVQRDTEVHRRLLDFTGTRARVDVITGTSAGGLNGALLAMAQVHGSDLEQVRDLWLDKGALETLLRSPQVPDPPSLMDGDDQLLPGITEALRGLVARPGDLPAPDDVPIHLIITSSLLDGHHRGVPDSFGSIVHDRDHRGEFTFRRGGGIQHHPDGCAHGRAKAADDDWAESETLARLALAARSTASFPIAFEPSFCPVNERAVTPGRPDMACHASFPTSRYVIDGGVLVNRPLAPALRAIFAQPASTQVRRVLAYVVPDPGGEMRDTATSEPTLAQVAVASLVGLPGNESVFSELDKLREHNERVAGQRRRRQVAAEAYEALMPLAGSLFERYRRLQSERISDQLVNLIAQGVAVGEGVSGDLPLAGRPVLRAGFARYLAGAQPERFPEPGVRVEDWFTTSDTVERAGALAIDVFGRTLRLSNPRSTAAAAELEALRALRAEVHAALRRARAARRPMPAAEMAGVARRALGGLDDETLASIVRRVLGDRDALWKELRALAYALRRGAPLVLAVCSSQTQGPAEPVKETETLARAFHVEGDGDRADDEVLWRVLALEVVQIALADDPPIVEQSVDLLQLSADATNGFDARATAGDKLAGLQLAHFGAFYKRSWRANDWLWGRLDGAQRLAQVVLDPARMRQLGYTAGEALDEIRAIAFAGLAADDETALRRAQPLPWDEDQAIGELAFLSNYDVRPPAALPICTQAVARRLQLDILRRELPRVAAAVRADAEAGSANGPAQSFADEVAAAGEQPRAAVLIDLFRSCQIGRERLALDGSPLMARTASHATAITAGALGGAKAGFGTHMMKVRRGVRGLGLAFFLLVRNAMAGSRVGAAAVTAAMATGGALVAAGLVVGHGGLLTLGAVLLLAGLATAGLRLRWWRGAALLLAAAALAALPRAVVTVADWVGDDDGLRWLDDALDWAEAPWIVLWLILGAVALGSLGTLRPASSPAARRG